MLASQDHWTGYQEGRWECNCTSHNPLWICYDVYQHCICKGLFHHGLEDTLDSNKAEDCFQLEAQEGSYNETLKKFNSITLIYFIFQFFLHSQPSVKEDRDHVLFAWQVTSVWGKKVVAFLKLLPKVEHLYLVDN